MRRWLASALIIIICLSAVILVDQDLRRQTLNHNQQVLDDRVPGRVLSPDPMIRAFIWVAGVLLMFAALVLVNRRSQAARDQAMIIGSRIQALREETRRLGQDLQSQLSRPEQHQDRDQQHLQMLKELVPVGLFCTDAQGKFTYVNRRWCELTGLSAKQAAGDGWLRAIDSRDRERVRDGWRQAVSSGAPYSSECRFHHTQGGISWTLIQAIPEQDETGRCSAYVGTNTDISRLKEAEEHLRESKMELQMILQDMQDTFYRTDEKGYLVRLSPSIEKLLGYAVTELLGKPVIRLCHDARDCRRLIALMKEEGGNIRDYEIRLQHQDGTVSWVAINAHYYRDAHDRIIGIEGTARDINNRKKIEAQMYKLSSALQQSADAAMISDPQGIIEYVNPAFEKMTGYHRDELIGKKTNIFKSGRQGSRFYRKLWQTILNGKVYREIFVNHRKDGSAYYEEKTITPLKDECGVITHFVATGKDVTSRVHKHKRLRFMAHHDVLTELPNRASFLGILKKSIDRASIHRRHVAVMFLDMDCFKDINDTLGHDAGDQVLKAYAHRLQGAVREVDVVARLGGDEFAILLDDMADVNNISRIAAKIISALSPPVVVDGREILLTVSIGISIFPEDGGDVQSLLKNADIAMYRAKDLGKNSFQFYSADLRAKALERMTMEGSLRQALENGEFLMHYQPQLNIQTNQIFGAEALLRWQHPELGLLSPGDFIPLLEESGLIAPVGEWVLEQVFSQTRSWHDSGFSSLRMAVNLSNRQFNDPEFIHTVERLIKITGVNPRMLELELTESAIMRNTRAANAALDCLDEMGVRFSIDDFGTGYSSLSYLKRFPIDTLKIDRVFVHDVTTNPDDAAIVSAIIGMAHNMHLHVIAEGVENPGQLDFLREHHCDAIQGYLFSQPLLPDSMTRLLREKFGQ